jgi:glucose-1-phosphate cytidylyltransferase
MITVLLAGGAGTRLAEETDVRPKPMVAIGGRPILWHIMKHYAHYCCREFIVALGYRGDVIKQYFECVEQHDEVSDDRIVHLVETGLDTKTGGRLKRLSARVDRSTFMMTYGDGLSNVDLGALTAFHRSHGKLATVTAVHPPARFGALDLDGDRVAYVAEKTQSRQGWINGGYFVLEPAVLDYIDGDHTEWEREPLERLAADGELMAYRHDAFWHPMDTLRDKRQLEALWAGGLAPWKVWP